MSEGLTDELIIAWNRLSFLHQVTQLMRQITDPWQLSLESLRLAADTIEAENAFVAQLSDDALDFQWLEPRYDESDTRRILVSLQDAGGILIRNGADACRKTFPRLPNLHSFMGQQLQVTAGPPPFIGLINRSTRRFTTGDTQLFESLAEQITTVIETESLHAEQIRAEQLNREMEIAREVQASFLPAQLPELPTYDFASALLPAQITSGDFYDVLQCQDGGLGFLVCDVAGKGVSAALLAAGIRATIRAGLQEGNAPGEVLQVSNAALLEDMDRTGRFATAMLVNLAPDSRELQYASAGHTAALWLQSGTLQVERLPSTTLPLGVLPDIDATSTSIDLKPDDVLLIYTDGLTEVENEAGEILGMAGVTDVLLATHPAPAQFILDSLIEANEGHRGHTPIADDLTLLVIKRQPADAPVPQ